MFVISAYWAISEKIQTRGLRTWNLQRYCLWKFQGSMEKEVEFPGPGVVQRKNCGIYSYHGSCWFLTLKFPRGVTQFCRIFRRKSLVFLFSKGEVTDLKIEKVFLPKEPIIISTIEFVTHNHPPHHPHPPPIFFLIAIYW